MAAPPTALEHLIGQHRLSWLGIPRLGPKRASHPTLLGSSQGLYVGLLQGPELARFRLQRTVLAIL